MTNDRNLPCILPLSVVKMMSVLFITPCRSSSFIMTPQVSSTSVAIRYMFYSRSSSIERNNNNNNTRQNMSQVMAVGRATGCNLSNLQGLTASYLHHFLKDLWSIISTSPSSTSKISRILKKGW